MVSRSHKIKNIGEIKQNVKNVHRCPECGKDIELGIERETLKNLQERAYFPYPHIHLHGDPLHAMLCYVDANLMIRNVGVIRSVEISRDSDTLAQIMRKWSNPF